nr:S-layer homology domain-containing protein [Butyricicoccus sp. AM18-35]
MKRRLLSAFLAVMMVLTMAPVAFAADEGGTTGVAKIGDVEYPTLQAAVDAANNGDTIVLKKSISATEIGEKKQLQFVKADMNVTLDLNQNTITAEAGEAIAINAANITLTVKNGTIENFAEGNYSDGVYAYKESNNLTLTFENIVLKSRTQGLAVQGLTSNSNVNIVNSKITSAEELGIYYPPKSGTLTISDSEITGVTGIVVKGSNLVVKGEKTIISGTGPNVDPETYYTGATDGSSTLTETGDALYIESGYNDRDISVSISGGHLNSKSAKAVRMFVKNGENTSAKREISVTGGTFSSDVSAYVAEGYVQNENGTVEQLGETNAVAKIDDTYYKTLAEAVSAADNKTVTLLKNVVLNSTLTLNKNMTLDLNGCEISNGSTMGTDYLVSIAANADVSIVGNKENSKISDSRSNAQGTITAVVVYGKLTVAGDNLTISRGANGIAIKVEDNPGTLIVNGGTITVDKPTQTSSQAIQNWGNATINGGIFNGDVDSYAYIAANKNYVGNMTIENGIFNGEVFAAQLQYNNQWPTASARVAITGGNFKGIIAEYYHDSTKGLQPVENVSKPANTAESEVVVSGGYFTTDPTNYVASGYVAGTSDVSGYSYKVVAKTNTGNVEVKPAVAKPEVKVDKIPQKDQETVKAAAATVSAPTLGAAAVDEAQKIDKSKADELVKNANEVAGNTADKKLYVQSALKVEPTAYDAENKTLALEITPQYRVVASTADTADKIKLDGDTKNAQVVQDYQTMNITKATVVTMELPTGFAVADGDKLSIQHTKSNDKVEYYTGTVTKKDDKFYLTFTTNGFSPFVISVPAASIGENVYPTLQAAVENVKKNETIKLAKDVDEAIVVTVAKSINFKVDANKKKFDAKKNIVAGTNTTVKVGETSPYIYEFTYTKPSSGGSSGGSSSGKTTYKVTTSAVNNGGVNASPSNAEKGATITITLSPDKGYKLDKLTVTDGSGKTVSTVKKSDTVYTFTMPASAVKVGVSYVKATETPSETKFNDVSANDWFASAVDYVTGKGMMNGTAANTFSPKANTTRGMVVTVLYRLENQPSTSAASFTDVASGAYYANAVAWANANGIVSGYGSGKFGPNDKVTREQLAAILYRYAQYKKYDVSGANSLDGYTDVQSVSSYAVPALQWANAAGVVTGKSGSKLDPKGNATRAEVAAMLMRFCENVK